MMSHSVIIILWILVGLLLIDVLIGIGPIMDYLNEII